MVTKIQLNTKLMWNSMVVRLKVINGEHVPTKQMGSSNCILIRMTMDTMMFYMFMAADSHKLFSGFMTVTVN